MFQTDLLKGKRILVTGGGTGLGLSMGRRFLELGAGLVICGRRAEVLKESAARLAEETGGKVEGFAGDLTQATPAEALAARFPAVEILVNNLGIFEPKPFEDIPDADWTRFFEANVLSGVRLARLYLPAMKAADGGRIIFISSESGVQIPAEMIHYGMTKTAQLSVSRGLAE